MQPYSSHGKGQRKHVNLSLGPARQVERSHWGGHWPLLSFVLGVSCCEGICAALRLKARKAEIVYLYRGVVTSTRQKLCLQRTVPPVRWTHERKGSCEGFNCKAAANTPPQNAMGSCALAAITSFSLPL